MAVVGLDGYRGGWIAVWIDGDQRRICRYANVSEMTRKTFDLAMIDMPIGLPCRGHRGCDLEAKRRLGRAGVRVFTGARRSLLSGEGYSKDKRVAANDRCRAVGDHGVSCQLWSLMPKIAEVDQIMTVERQLTIREAHPEMVFFRLNGCRPLDCSKKTEKGRNERRKLLAQQGFVELDDWLGSWRIGTGAKEDDVMDACACAIAARDAPQGNCLPRGTGCRDRNNLLMQIWY